MPSRLGLFEQKIFQTYDILHFQNVLFIRGESQKFENCCSRGWLVKGSYLNLAKSILRDISSFVLLCNCFFLDCK